MHEADNTYSIRSTCLCYWLDQFLMLVLIAWILSELSTFHWICLLFILLILVGVQLPLCIVLYPRKLQSVFWSQVEYKIVSFYLLVKMNVSFHPKVDCSLCVWFSYPKNSILLSDLWCMVWIKSCLHVNSNLEIFCLNWNNLEIINCIKILAAKSNSDCLKSLQTKFHVHPHKDERKHSFLVTSPGVEKCFFLWCTIFLSPWQQRPSNINFWIDLEKSFQKMYAFITILPFLVSEIELFK